MIIKNIHTPRNIFPHARAVMVKVEELVEIVNEHQTVLTVFILVPIISGGLNFNE